MAEKSQNQFDIDDLKAPLLAAVGAADLALERVNEIVAALRERAGEARTDAETRVEDSRARITRLQEELPSQFDDIRERLSSEELRKFADSYAEAAQTTYTKLIERGEAALERLRSQPGPKRPRAGSRVTPTRPSSSPRKRWATSPRRPAPWVSAPPSWWASSCRRRPRTLLSR